MLKKLLAVLLVFSLAACGATDTTDDNMEDKNDDQMEDKMEDAMYEDGFYFAQDPFEGGSWVYYLAFDVEDGKIKNVDWNGVNHDGGKTKAELAAAGMYVLASQKDGGEGLGWDVQSAELSKLLEETQSIDSVNLTDDDGHTDSVTGVTVKVGSFVSLFNEAISNGPVEKGSYTDGAYYAENDEFGNGYKYKVGLTVKYGMILSVGWDAINEEADGPTKRKASMDGDYVLANDGGLQWHEQALLMEQALLESQDVATINLSDDDGHTDSVSGATIKVGDFVTLVQKALDNGPQ
jgi:major membrane immunogen (membrane-anchored lipoprotein)